METEVPQKKRRLTKKQRGFVNDYADTGNATQAVKNNYDVKNDLTARVIGSENLTKPNIIEELKLLGFDSNNAKRVVGEILNDESVEPKDRLKAGEIVLKASGDMAPEKQGNTTNIQVNMISYARDNNSPQV